jgi:hypothetical protein
MQAAQRRRSLIASRTIHAIGMGRIIAAILPLKQLPPTRQEASMKA